MNNATETMTIDGVEYTLRTHLDWVEADRLTTAGIKLLVDGQTIARGEDLDDLDTVEVTIDQGTRNLQRLAARLIGLNKHKIEHLSRSHVVQLLAKVDELERAEAAELGDLAPKASIARRLLESSATPSSSE
jgi:hypothetical protein